MLRRLSVALLCFPALGLVLIALEGKLRADATPCSSLRAGERGQITDMAALNIKNNVEVRIENCAFWDNEICLRLRGEGKFGGARVQVHACSFYTSDIAVRYEDRKERLKSPLFKAGTEVAVTTVTKDGKEVVILIRVYPPK